MQTQDPQLINNLIQQGTGSSGEAPIQEENHVSVNRVVTAKYKVYVIILLVFGVLIGVNYFFDGYNKYLGSKNRLQSTKEQITELEKDIASLNADKAHLLLLKKNEEQILSCSNKKEDCEKLAKPLEKNFALALSYLQLGDLYSDKMQIDEEKILKNLDQYLIKNDPNQNISTKNGDISKISIGEAKEEKNLLPKDLSADQIKLYQLPVVLDVQFSDKDDLVSFVKNVESFIVPNQEDRILYKIETISYDMVAYNEAQIATIELSAYYFN